MSLALAFIFGVTALVAGGVAAKNRTSEQSSKSGIVVGSEKDLRITNFEFNDSGSGSSDIWSASKIEAYLKKNSPAYASTSVKRGNVVFFGDGNELIDKGVVIDDISLAASNVIWSSEKITNIIAESKDGYMVKMPSALPGNLCTFDTNGQVIDSNVKVNDSGTGNQDLWTASKIISLVKPQNQMKLVPSANPNTVAVFDNVGQVKSSGKIIDDSVTPSESVLWTSSKTQTAINAAASSKMKVVDGAKMNNWAMFNGSGQVIDSGVTLNDAGNSASDVWSSTKIQSVIDSTLKSATSGISAAVAAQSADCQSSIDKASAINNSNLNLLNSLSADLKTKMNMVPTAKINDAAVFDASGQVVDSKLVFNDAGTSSTDIWSASKISSSIAAVETKLDNQLATQTGQQNTLNTQIQNQISSLQQQESNLDAVLKTKMDLVPAAISGNISIFNGKGQAVDGGFALDDAAVGTTVLWSSAKVKSMVDSSSTASSNAISAANTQIATTTSNLSGKMNLQPTAKNNSVALFNASGQAIGSNYIINDAGTTVTDLWTGSKIQSAIDTRVSYTGVPTSNNLALWTSSKSVGDSNVSINDSTATTSNLWTAAKTKAYWDEQMLKTYSTKCWFKGSVVESVTIGSSKQNLLFNVTDASACTSPGVKSSVALSKGGVYQINLWLLLTNASTAIGKMLVFTPNATQSLRMPIFVVNGKAVVSYQTVCFFSAGSNFTIPVQITNVDGVTAAVGSSCTIETTNTQGNLFAVQEM